MKGTVAAGKTYFILLFAKHGLNRARLGMEIVAPDDPQLVEWLQPSRRMELDPLKTEEYERKYKRKINKALENVQRDKAKYTTFDSSQGR